jgi:prevent-host-death family protein
LQIARASSSLDHAWSPCTPVCLRTATKIPMYMLQCSTMNRIGIRDLRQNASEWIRRVERGESFEVTARGRPVAWLVPAQPDDILARLESEGSLRRGEGDLVSLTPLPAEPGKQELSEILRGLRAEER